MAITVERLPDGEVSPYLTQELRTGDQIEIRGPVGGYFAWRPEGGGPLLLIACGSGIGADCGRCYEAGSEPPAPSRPA